jgi:DNA-binding MarR family transcriptional regulator
MTKKEKNIVQKGNSALAEKMADLTFNLVKTCQHKEQNFAASFGLTTTEFRCLRYFRNTNAIPIKELTKLLHVTPGRITHILTALEKKKLLIRKIDEGDRRGITAYLTDKSAVFIQNLNASHVKLHKEILDGISQDKQAAIVNAMEELLTALKIWSVKN